MPLPLNRKNANITSRRPVKVLQFGEGNFMRAFADWIIDKLNEDAGFNGDVQIVQPIPQGTADLINRQEGLYHVVLNGLRDGTPVREIRLIQSVRGVINPYTDPEGYLKTAENPDLQIVLSNTTEAGIAFNPNDIDPGQLPASFPGKLAVWLYRRFNYFNGAPKKALTIIPCELIDRNGATLQEVILQYIRLWNLPDEFQSWIQQHTTFCNTLVDRIVPGFPREHIAEIQQEIGFDDKLVVTAEPFHLWVIEGPESLQNLLPTKRAGLDVLFVNNQAPYRTRKVRILNGAHTVIVPVAYLHGLRTVRDAVEDPFAGAFLEASVQEEIIPTLDLPACELDQFARNVIERFRNPYIRHELKSIALNSISKFRVRVLPSLLEYVSRFGALPSRLTFSLACLIRFYQGEWQGETMPVSDDDAVLRFFREAWSTGDEGKVTLQTLANAALWDGRDLTTVPGLTRRVNECLQALREHNVASAWEVTQAKFS